MANLSRKRMEQNPTEVEFHDLEVDDQDLEAKPLKCIICSNGHICVIGDFLNGQYFW